MENIKVGELKDTDKTMKNGYQKKLSPLSKLIEKRLRKLKPGKCFEISGIDSEQSANLVRSRVAARNKKIKTPYLSTLQGDVLVFAHKKSK